jgi:hypothetical protein
MFYKYAAPTALVLQMTGPANPAAAGRGVTAARIATLTAAIAAFGNDCHLSTCSFVPKRTRQRSTPPNVRTYQAANDKY